METINNKRESKIQTMLENQFPSEATFDGESEVAKSPNLSDYTKPKIEVYQDISMKGYRQTGNFEDDDFGEQDIPKSSKIESDNDGQNKKTTMTRAQLKYRMYFRIVLLLICIIQING